ncbi:acyl transferase/acyl hydrolase/lysophospholipase [Mycena leptocephala]|nr:acyl transferase/acyl hydrolase/lysophospholipase [Mycena leptocephala]
MTEPSFWKNRRETACCPARSVLIEDVLSPPNRRSNAQSVTSHLQNPPPLLAMDNPGTPGLRLLSLDGGGIRGLSMLIILEDLMWKLKVAEDLPDWNKYRRVLIALMLGRLRMSVKDAVRAYGELSKEVFSDVKSKGSDGRFKASKLEKAIKGIVGAHSASQDPEEGMEDTRENPCKTFVCAMNAANMSLPVLFRTYNTTNNPAIGCTIWQAGRATSAAPTFFKQIRIGPPGIEEALWMEVVFPDHQIACIISLGTGQPHTIKIPTPSLLKRLFPLDVIEAIKGIATDCEKQHQLSAHHFDPVPHVYFRFNVERGMQDIQLNQWERLGDVAANTRQYLLSHPTQNQLVNAVKSLVERLEGFPLKVSGRQDILAKMDEYFSKDIGERHIYVLRGLGGSGKTQIGLKFLDMIADIKLLGKHCYIIFTKQFFINASSLQTLDTALKNIAIAHKIGTSSEDGLLWLISQREEWMLLFDNADNPSIDLFDFFPKCTHGNIIITSRNPQLAVHGPRSHSRVGDMNETDAIDLLLLSAVKEKTLKDSECFRNCQARIVPNSSASIQHSLMMIIDGLIPESIFEQAAESAIYSDAQEAQTLQEARQFLQNFLYKRRALESIVLESGSSARATIQHTGAMQIWLSHTVNLEGYQEQSHLKDCAGEASSCLVQTIHTLSAMANLAGTYHKLGRYKRQSHLKAVCWRSESNCLLPHTANLEGPKRQSHLKHCAGEAEAATWCRPSTHLWAMAHLAVTYRELGRYQEAEPLESIVLEKQKQLLGSDHPRTLLAMANLAATYRELGRYQEAEPLESIVLEKRKQLLGADHPKTLSAMARLATTYHKLGRHQEAAQLDSSVLEKQRQLLGADHLKTLKAMGNLAAHTVNLEGTKRQSHLKALCWRSEAAAWSDHPDTLMLWQFGAHTRTWKSKRQSHLKALSGKRSSFV